MKYFLDTEFIEGTQKKKILGIPYGETQNTIDLISIGIVSEDKREYYAISKDFNIKEAWNRYQIKEVRGSDYWDEVKEYWIRENVLKPIFDEMEFWYRRDFQWRLKEEGEYIYSKKAKFTLNQFKYLLSVYGKTNKEIAKEVIDFCSGFEGDFNQVMDDNIQFYAYYCSYDWVVFCWLFGKMIDLPKGFPKYCNDLKVMLNDIAARRDLQLAVNDSIPLKGIDQLELHPDYPKKEGEHNALQDAWWDFRLYNFINKISKQDDKI
ncbi:hypothetical protein Phi17218_120 [Cellulophaga phage phi17:2_18]|uniref:Uncharacterized protein n=2 Tax=Lightbulbvirus Cba172 TaxID=1918525 RepID=S0A0A8_9CAUD|nr:Rnase H [Cellulophaga phage phi17:2]AGO47653.1 hypothetical protein Phi17:2_gp120 [Cellulophaga phage phi17:2]ALO80523.1 hypothetical protein Phi17218_120 [Cellulophaga phage phi17:2_18]